jgi:hypothetical protein
MARWQARRGATVRRRRAVQEAIPVHPAAPGA